MSEFLVNVPRGKRLFVDIFKLEISSVTPRMVRNGLCQVRNAITF